jgi:hypothetical protein
MPDFRAQFRDPKTPYVYMGGRAVSCGGHPTMPQRHRWAKPTEHKAAFGFYHERMCLNCGLTESI